MIKSHITEVSNTHQPDVTINSENVVVNCKYYCQECQFSIADELGRILKKGILCGETVIPFEGISPGFYHLIIFNEIERFRYPLKIN